MSSQSPAPALYIVSATVRLSVRYLSVLFPFNQSILLSVLPRIGFVTPQNVPLPPSRTRLAATGQIATKGDVRLSIQDEKFVLGVSAPDVEAAVRELGSVEDLLTKELGFDSEGHAHFYEVIADMVVAADCSPIEVLPSCFSGVKLFGDLSQILGQAVSNFTLRLVPPSGSPTERNWFDITIEPDLTNPTHWYSVNTVYRQQERQKVLTFTLKLPDTVNAILARVKRT